MEKVIAFAKYLEALDIDINEFSFQEAVNLHTEVQRTITNYRNAAKGIPTSGRILCSNGLTTKKQ